MSKKLNQVILTEKIEKNPEWVEDLVKLNGIKPMAFEMLIMGEIKEVIFQPDGYLIGYCVNHNESPTQKGSEYFIRETFNVATELKIKE